MSVALGWGLTVCISCKFPNDAVDAAGVRSTLPASCVFPAVLQERMKRREQIRVPPWGPCKSHVPHGSARLKPRWEVGSRRGAPHGLLPGQLESPTELLRMQIPRLSCWTQTRWSGLGLSEAVLGDFGAQLGLGSFSSTVWEAATPGK